MRLWGVALGVVATLAMTVGSSAQPKLGPGDREFWHQVPNIGMCAAAYAFRHREEPNSERGKAAKAAAIIVTQEVVRTTGKSAKVADGDAIYAANKMRAVLLGNDTSLALKAEDIPWVVERCDMAFDQKVAQAWAPKVTEDSTWNNKAQLVCATFYQRAISRAETTTGQSEAARASQAEIRRYAGRIDRTVPETTALVRENAAAFDKAKAEGRITETKIIESIRMCDNFYSYYVADNYETPTPFDCRGAYNATIAKGNELYDKFEASKTAADAAYWGGMRCGAIEDGRRRLAAHSCPADLTGKLATMVEEDREVLAKANSLSDAGEYYQCSLTP